MALCTCAMQVSVMAGAVPSENKAIKATKMSILDLGPYMFGDVDQQIGWFQSKGLLGTSKTCPACSQPMPWTCKPAVMPLTSIGGDVVTLPVGRYLDEFISVAGTSWKHCLHSSGKSVSGHCAQVPRLKNVGFRVVPSAGPHLRLSKSCHQVSALALYNIYILQRQKFAHVIRHMVYGCGFLQLYGFWTS